METLDFHERYSQTSCRSNLPQRIQSTEAVMVFSIHHTFTNYTNLRVFHCTGYHLGLSVRWRQLWRTWTVFRGTCRKRMALNHAGMCKSIHIKPINWYALALLTLPNSRMKWPWSTGRLANACQIVRIQTTNTLWHPVNQGIKVFYHEDKQKDLFQVVRLPKP